MNRPHLLVNVAMTADGKLDSVARQGATISSAADKARVDRLRAEVDAVMVGGRTLLDEDPKLTVKSTELRQERINRGLSENPARVGVVTEANIKLDGVFMTAGVARRLIYTTARTSSDQLARLRTAGAEVFVLGEQRVDLPAVLVSLSNLGVKHLMVEGGGTLIAAFIQLGLVDEIMIYLAPRLFGGATAPTLVDGPGFSIDLAPHLRLLDVVRFDELGGLFLHYQVEKPLLDH